MPWNVVDWLIRMKEALAGGGAPDEVRQALALAQRSRARVDLEPFSSPAGAPILLASTIEQVRRDDLIIAQPTKGARTYPLATGEKLRMSFAIDDTRLTAQTTALGRFKTRSGGSGGSRAGGVFYGYRLTMPQNTLLMTERRVAYRAPVATDVAPEAELHVLDQGVAVTVRGVVEDLSVGGMKLRSRNATGRLMPGQRVFLKLVLPEPVGVITEMVHIAHMREAREPDVTIIGVRFERKIPEMHEAVKALDLERKSRRRSA